MTARLSKALTVLALVTLVAATAWSVRTRLHLWTHDRLAERISAHLASLPQRKAVRLLRQLATADDEWLAVLVPALADECPEVAATAANVIDQLVEHWSQRPPAESWPRIEKLAALLAQHASKLPVERINRAQSLAQRLIDWPTGGRSARAAEFIANCEVVLRLTPAEPGDIRVAAATQP
jgi:hypothetical protein